VRAPREAAVAPRIAYYVRQFPTLSETFIQREIAALLDLGLPIEVIAEEAQTGVPFDEEAQRLAARTHYLGPRAERSLRPELRLFLRERPLTVVNLYLYSRLRAARPASRTDPWLWRRALRLAGVLRALGVTHVHSPWAFPSTRIVPLAARLADVRFTMQPRASDIHRRSRLGLGERLRHADLIITNAHYNVAPIRSHLAGIDRDIHVIYEGVDPRRLQPPADRAPRGGEALLLTVSRLVEPKGLDVLLRACRILKDEGRAVRCAIVGGRVAAETNHYVALKRLHRALDLGAVVDFLGSRSFADVMKAYAEADVYVLAAHEASDGRRDVTPNTLIEAMAMELPIVSTRSGAIPELIEDEVSGLLVAPRDERALASAIARLLDDPELRRSLGCAARRRVLERFDLTRNVRRYAELFGFAVAGRETEGG
jgi:glycosyltransferase involved in cell wall biosynthesis